MPHTPPPGLEPELSPIWMLALFFGFELFLHLPNAWAIDQLSEASRFDRVFASASVLTRMFGIQFLAPRVFQFQEDCDAKRTTGI